MDKFYCFAILFWNHELHELHELIIALQLLVFRTTELNSFNSSNSWLKKISLSNFHFRNKHPSIPILILSCKLPFAQCSLPNAIF